VSDDIKFDAAMMGRLGSALSFICGAEHPATVALKKAAETGADKDVKAARAQFLKIKPNERRAALAMLDD
jgi:hypothetical protein